MKSSTPLVGSLGPTQKPFVARRWPCPLSAPLLVVSLALTACGATAEKPEATTGKVAVVLERESTDESGAISIRTETLEEIADRSIADEGAEALLTPQKFAVIGSQFFSAYSPGLNEELVVSIYGQEGKSGSDIWVFRGGKMRLTKSNYFNQDPSFSNDGQAVYFTSTRGKDTQGEYDQNSYVWRLPSQGSGGLTRIGTPSYKISNPVESPDGTKILFSTREYVENSDFIWYMQKNGALPTMLKQGQYASWIDNDTIVFSTPDESTGLFSIWTCDLDGSNLTQIIADKEMDCILPSVSPDGKHLAFVKQLPKASEVEQNRSRDIYAFRFEDGLSQQLTTNTSRDDMPKWSRNGDHLYFRSSRGLSWAIWRLDTQFLNPAAMGSRITHVTERTSAN